MFPLYPGSAAAPNTSIELVDGSEPSAAPLLPGDSAFGTALEQVLDNVRASPSGPATDENPHNVEEARTAIPKPLPIVAADADEELQRFIAPDATADPETHTPFDSVPPQFYGPGVPRPHRDHLAEADAADPLPHASSESLPLFGTHPASAALVLDGPSHAADSVNARLSPQPQATDDRHANDARTRRPGGPVDVVDSDEFVHTGLQNTVATVPQSTARNGTGRSSTRHATVDEARSESAAHVGPALSARAELLPREQPLHADRPQVALPQSTPIVLAETVSTQARIDPLAADDVSDFDHPFRLPVPNAQISASASEIHQPAAASPRTQQIAIRQQIIPQQNGVTSSFVFDRQPDHAEPPNAVRSPSAGLDYQADTAIADVGIQNAGQTAAILSEPEAAREAGRANTPPHAPPEPGGPAAALVPPRSASTQPLNRDSVGVRSKAGGSPDSELPVTSSRSQFAAVPVDAPVAATESTRRPSRGQPNAINLHSFSGDLVRQDFANDSVNPLHQTNPTTTAASYPESGFASVVLPSDAPSSFPAMATDGIQAGPPAGLTPTVEQVTRAVLSRSPDDDAEVRFEMQLDPPELGRVSVRLTRIGDSLTASLVAAEESTRAVLANDLTSLRDDLREAGITLSDIDVSSDQQRQRQTRDHERRFLSPYETTRPSDVERPRTPPESPLARNGRLDVRA